jgi:hypothetical protein
MRSSTLVKLKVTKSRVMWSLSCPASQGHPWGHLRILPVTWTWLLHHPSLLTSCWPLGRPKIPSSSRLTLQPVLNEFERFLISYLCAKLVLYKTMLPRAPRCDYLSFGRINL